MGTTNPFGKALYENEERLVAFFKEKGIAYSPYRLSVFKTLQKDGNLLGFAKATGNSENYRKYAALAHDTGLLTCLDLALNYLEQGKINPNDRLKVGDLVEGNVYTGYEIAALGNKYSVFKGMASFQEGTKHYASIKTQPGGTHHGYADEWIVEGKTYRYSIEVEDEENLEHYTFSKKPNRVIFDSINTDLLSILLFIKEKKKGGFVYHGEFKALGFDKESKTFTLGKRDLKNDEDIEREIDRFEEQFVATSDEDIVSGKKPLRQVGLPQKRNPRRKEAAMPKTIPDFVARERINIKIGDIGEKAVYEYEKNKIRAALRDKPKLAEDLVSKVRWVSKEKGGADYGYDIQSFNIEGGKVVPIFIEVKTTSQDAGQAFFITRHELETAKSEAVNRNYYIYRVYNINADSPEFFAIKGEFLERFYQLEPNIYLAKLR